MKHGVSKYKTTESKKTKHCSGNSSDAIVNEQLEGNVLQFKTQVGDHWFQCLGLRCASISVTEYSEKYYCSATPGKVSVQQ